jgi:hypothetical protein
MAKSLKYYTLPKSKVTIWEKPLKAGGVFYYLYLDQTQVDSNKVEEVVKIIRERLPNSSVSGKKTAKTFQISYSLPNGEKAQGLDETMLEFVDDKLQEFGYDDTKNQAVSTRGKKMIGTYANVSSTIKVVNSPNRIWKVGDEFHTEVDKSDIRKIISIGNGVVYIRNSDGSVGEWTDGVVDTFFKHGTWILVRPTSSSSIVWRVGDKFYHKSHPTNIFEIQSIIGDDVIILLPDNKTTVDYKISAVGDFFREGNWVLTQPPVSQAQVPEIKANQFYIDFENKGKLLLVELVENNDVHIREDYEPYVKGGFVISRRGFEEKISDGKIKLYIPEGGDEWTRFDLTTLKPDSVFRVLTNAKGKVEYAVYDSEGNYVMTDNDDEYTFKNYLLNNSFHLTTPQQSSTSTSTTTSNSQPSKKLKPKFRVDWHKGDHIVIFDEDIDVIYENTNTGQVLESHKLYYILDADYYVGYVVVERFEFVVKIDLSHFQKSYDSEKFDVYKPELGDVWRLDRPPYVNDNEIIKVDVDNIQIRESIPNVVPTTTLTNVAGLMRTLLSEPWVFKGKNVLKSETSQQKAENLYSEKSKLKKELKDLVELKDLISDLDFEDKVNVSTLITQTQNKINDIIGKELEEKIGDNQIFEELFEQSFRPLEHRYDDKLEKNDLPELVAPNGEMSDLNEEITNVVNSELFTEWFGDFKTAYFYRNMPDLGGMRVSKVISDKFEPLVVWHGTNKQFSYFRFDNFPAAYFAVNRKYSDFFAKSRSEDGVGYVLPFFLNINNPLDLSIFGLDSVKPKDFFDWMYLKTGMTPEELEVNPMLLDNTFPDAPIWMYLRNNPTMLKKIADMGVYDGMKFYEFCPNIDPDDESYSTLAYITFDPNQAKLADPNRGQILLASLKSFMLEKGGSV